jgi:cyclic beta-1,2-glucan synthetase
MYRLMLESILGLRLDTDRLHFVPCMPEHWKDFKLHYRYKETFYHIAVQRVGRGNGVLGVTALSRRTRMIHLSHDRNDHHAEVKIG